MSRWSGAPRRHASGRPPAIAVAKTQVPATIRSVTVRVLDRARAARRPATVSVEARDPLDLRRPSRRSISHRSTISGSRATLSMTVRALGEHRGHQQVLGGPHRGEVQPEVRAASAGRAPRRRPSRARCAPRRRAPPAPGCACPGRGSRCVAAGQRHAGPAAPGDQRAEHAIEARSRRTSSYGASCAELLGHVDVTARPAVEAPGRPARGRSISTVQPSSLEQLAHHVRRRGCRGTLCTTVRPRRRAARPPSASGRCSSPRRRTTATARAVGRSGPSDTTRKLLHRTGGYRSSARPGSLGWGHGQPHAHLHPHRRRRRDPPRRHERDQQERPAAAGLRRRRRGQRPPRRRAGRRRARRRRRRGADPRAERPVRRRRRLLHAGRATTRSSRRCASSRTTSTGSRPGATTTTRTCPSCARSSSTAAPRAPRTCTSPAPSSAAPSARPGRPTSEHADTMNVLAITLPQPALATCCSSWPGTPTARPATCSGSPAASADRARSAARAARAGPGGAASSQATAAR